MSGLLGNALTASGFIPVWLATGVLLVISAIIAPAKSPTKFGLIQTPSAKSAPHATPMRPRRTDSANAIPIASSDTASGLAYVA